MQAYQDVPSYVATLTGQQLAYTQKMHALLHTLIPDGEDVISYNMPAIRWQGHVVVYYAAATKHFGLYPTGAPIAALAAELAPYSTSKGTIRFAYNQPLPTALISLVVRTRLAGLTE